MKTKEIHFSLFYFLFNYVVDRSDAKALARDKRQCGNGDFLITGNKEKVKSGFSYSNLQLFFFFQENKQT